MLELRQTEIDLLTNTAKILSEELNENKDALHVKMKAFNHLLDGDEEVEVHIIVTRDKDDFLDDLAMEVMNRF